MILDPRCRQPPRQDIIWFRVFTINPLICLFAPYTPENKHWLQGCWLTEATQICAHKWRPNIFSLSYLPTPARQSFQRSCVIQQHYFFIYIFSFIMAYGRLLKNVRLKYSVMNVRMWNLRGKNTGWICEWNLIEINTASLNPKVKVGIPL